jgi:GTP cyclohydrolase I
MCDKKILSNGNLILSKEEKQEKKEKLEKIFQNMLSELGFDWENDPNQRETPKRMAKMYMDELLVGCYSEPPNITKFPNTKDYDEMIISGPISVKSMCSHHYCPFIGHAWVGYIPDKEVVGLSKLARITQFFMRRPQIQEELNQQIANYIQDLLNPKGVIVVIRSQHHCMTIRGVEEPNSWMYTSSVRGAFAENPETRKEFFDVCNIKAN